MSDHDLFAGVLCRGPVTDAVGGAVWLRALLDAEGALARAGARTGVVPWTAAGRVAPACADVHVDVTALSQDAARAGSSVVPLVGELERAAGKQAGADALTAAELERLLDPVGHTGQAGEFLDRALAHHEQAPR